MAHAAVANAQFSSTYTGLSMHCDPGIRKLPAKYPTSNRWAPDTVIVNIWLEISVLKATARQEQRQDCNGGECSLHEVQITDGGMSLACLQEILIDYWDGRQAPHVQAAGAKSRLELGVP